MDVFDANNNEMQNKEINQPEQPVPQVFPEPTVHETTAEQPVPELISQQPIPEVTVETAVPEANTEPLIPAVTERGSAWDSSSFIREYSPAVGETYPESGVEPVNPGFAEGTVPGVGYVAEEAEKPVERIHETVKRSGFKKFVAIAVAAGIVNLAALGGIFFVGYRLGSVSSNVEAQRDDATNSKDQVLGMLKEETQTPSDETSGASTTANQGGELSTVDISKKVGPSVVGITSTVESGMSIFGGMSYAEGTGSGIIISADGYVVTNNHVIEGAASVKVTLNTGSEYEAELIGADSKTDLAVIKISPNEQLTVAELGDSSAIEVGERAIAIGNPLGMEFFGSTTQGIISAINRTITVDNKTMSVIQTDAAINEGNSGGALVNAYGQVIGINAVKISSSTVEGMGFAIPISEAKPVISDLIEFGYVKGRPVIGISTRDVTDYMAKRQNWPMGVQVMETQMGTGAEIAGLEQGDIITKADGQEIKTIEDLNKIKNSHKPGESIQMEVYKYETGLKKNVSVRLGEERPE